ncbi:MAG: ATP-binding protein [Blastomonas fulva]|uniref:ATP-dependent nuclease n=1 Tax=Blastomonas fulva TaxID=1550728 RepID=UPI0024E2075E|nr:AAA family ATPase [Blastomonas fulva]MDK2758368.1 ATP-binding protein [Blastomonas fulva]
MAIRSFSVAGRKSLISASYDGLPDLVFVTGANGAGKSSLLTLLKDQGVREEGTKVLHIGPHRPWRKGSLLKASVLGMPMSFGDMLTNANLPHFQGAVPYSIQNFQGQARDPDASDEAQALVKVSFAVISEKYRDRLQELHQTFGKVSEGDIPDPYDPLRELLTRLLPHLVFNTIEEIDKNNVRVLFRSIYQSTDAPFDIDELSSGEKAILTLFLPVLEYQIDKILGIEHAGSKRTFLIDEPELHLHPALQSDMVAYFRHLAQSDDIQFIVATHSPTMIDAAQPDELFILMPWQASWNGNQFSKLADNADRLLAIRELLGSAYTYSRGRPVLFIEGEFASDTNKHTDIGLLELMLPDFRGYAFVPSRGRTQAIAGAERLRRAAAEQEHPITAYALVDADYESTDQPWVFPWPVCMVENLLLDPQSIAAVLKPYVPHGALASAEAVRQSLMSVAQGLRDEEVRRRLKAVAGTATIRPNIVVAGNEVSVDIGSVDWDREVHNMRERVETERGSILAEIDLELLDGSALRRFSGKQLLQSFFASHAQPHFPKMSNFTFALAQQVAVSGFATRLVAEAIRRVNAYFPVELQAILVESETRKAAEDAAIQIDALLDWAGERLDAFNGISPYTKDGTASERDLVRLLSYLRTSGDHNLYNKLRPLVSDVLAR